jgi:glutamate 5-kinase
VVKIGSSSLASAVGGIDDARLGAVVAALAPRQLGGTDVVLVSSGAIASGLAPLGLPIRPRDLATQQAAASVGQGLLMHRYTEAAAAYGITVGQVLLTSDDLVRRAQYGNARRTLQRLLALSVLPVVNENDTVATEEIRFGDNDRLAALVAHLIGADLLVLLSDVDGLYASDPRRRGAERIVEVRDAADLAHVQVGRVGGLGSGGMQTKLEAASIAMSAGIPVVLAAAPDLGAALAGDEIGTWFHPSANKPAARRLWLAHATTARGRLHLDAGAVNAIVHRRSSLLPAGVTGADGRFVAGDPVDLVDPAGHAIARGVVAYGVEELPALLGRSTHELADTLGPEYARELVHRDDLVVLPGAKRSPEATG